MVERTENQAALTPMSDHVERFWRQLETETVRILVNLRRDQGAFPYEDSSSYPDDVAKALVTERSAAHRRIEELTRALEEFADPRNWVVNGRFDPHSGNFDATSFARGILASKQGGAE